MGFPPPPHDGPPHPHGQGGGFGPPPQGFGPPPAADGFGPPPPPADGYGSPQQGGGYGPSGPPGPPVPPGGYGYPGGGYPPPQPPPNHTGRNVWIAVGAVAVVGVIVGVIAASSGGGTDPSAKDTPAVPSLTALPTIPTMPTIPTIPMPGFTLPTDFPSLDLPTDFPSGSDLPEPSASDREEMPYVVVEPGKCFNMPSMTPGIDTVETVSCTSAHDAQSIADKTLSGTFTTKDQIEKKAFSLCEADATKHAPAGGDYYSYVLFPELITYQLQGRRTVTCALTLNNGSNGKKLHSRLS